MLKKFVTKISKVLFKKFIVTTSDSCVQAVIVNKTSLPARYNDSFYLFAEYYYPTWINDPIVYITKIRYNNLSLEITDSRVYNNYKQGDTINVTLRKEYNYWGELIREKLIY